MSYVLPGGIDRDKLGSMVFKSLTAELAYGAHPPTPPYPAAGFEPAPQTEPRHPPTGVLQPGLAADVALAVLPPPGGAGHAAVGLIRQPLIGRRSRREQGVAAGMSYGA
ncbi:hypothetical protein HaLaN_02778 [Haematococcus lacustris]|uniref:Uncharacterized protein n=1 Tax=Haematococcus lacustris TaxID=44745 RepID=A0A699YCZ7_HAELA|nr:hypothetical protein HaLaN_02778 [Haematococcus lacustris]